MKYLPISFVFRKVKATCKAGGFYQIKRKNVEGKAFKSRKYR
jgi:hypothetical protein